MRAKSHGGSGGQTSVSSGNPDGESAAAGEPTGVAAAETTPTSGGSSPSTLSPAKSKGQPNAGGNTTRPAPGLAPAVPLGRKIPAGAGVHGVSDTTISVGIPTVDLTAAVAAISAVSGAAPQPGASSGDPQKAAQAVVDYINSHGGVAGRKLAPIYYKINASSYTNAAGRQQEQQQACATWTQDNHVFAVDAAGMTEQNFLECMFSTGTVMIPVSFMAQMSDATYNKNANFWYSASNVLPQRRERALVEALWAQGALKGATVGVIVEDAPGSRAGVDLGMIPALQAHGVKVAKVISYPDFISSPWQNYVLQMQTAGVDHILMSTTAGSVWSTFFMMKAADNQGYKPKWGIGSDNGPEGLQPLGAPAAQLANAQGMGWNPQSDKGDLSPQGPNGALCEKITAAAGQPSNLASAYCEPLFLLQAALNNASDVSPAAMSASVRNLATSFGSIYGIGGQTSFGTGRHDGVSVYSDLAFDDRCGQSGAHCFRYAGAPKAMP